MRKLMRRFCAPPPSSSITTRARMTIALLLASFGVTGSAQALDGIVRPFQGIRSLGMGNVRYTTGLYEENFYGNPARVTDNPSWRFQLPDPMIEVSANTLSQVSEILGSDDVVATIADSAGKNNRLRIQTSFPGIYLPGVFKSKWSVAAALLTSVQVDAILRRSFDVQPSLITDVGPSITVGRKLLRNDRLSIGVTTHVAYRLASPQALGFQNIIQGQSLAPNDLGQEGAHVDFSTGATYRFPFRISGWSLHSALAVNNMLGGRYDSLGVRLIRTTNLNPPIRQPRTYNVGFRGARERLWKFTDTSLAIEFTDIGNNSNGSIFRLLHLGAETHWKRLAIRAGLNQGYWSAGVGLDLSLLQLDFACYGEELGLNVGDFEDRRLALRIAFQL